MESATGWELAYEPSLVQAHPCICGDCAGGGGVVAVVASRATGVEFQQYVVSTGMMSQAGSADTLVEYYAGHGTWDGVQNLLAQLGPGATGTGMGMGLGRGRGAQGTAGPNLTIADPSGRVVASKTGEAVGDKLPQSILSQGLPLTLRGQQVGTLLNLHPAEVALDPQGESFLRQVRLSLVWAALLAIVAALALGAILSRRLAAPLVRLTTAATAIAGGNLDQEVRVQGADEISQLGDAFNHMAHSLADAEALRRNMVADVAHELRTPLTVIQGNLQAILDGVYPLDVEQVASIYDETRLLTRLVDDLRDLALADAGQLRMESLPVDVAALAQRAVTNFSSAADASDIKLNLETDGTASEVLGDADRLSQVLRNLLSNALRHTDRGGTVRRASQR